jgi:uncharacterized phiE125 gp8 family phage protein
MTDYNPVRTAAPATPPVSLAEVKQHLRVVDDDENALITTYLDAVVGHLDGEAGWLGRAIVAQTWSQQFDAFEREIRLDLAPVSTISSVVYEDEAGDPQTVAAENYELINGGASPVVRFTDDFSFPVVSDAEPVLTITFVSGYGAAAAAPGPLKAAIFLMVGDLYSNREAWLPSGLIANPTARMLLDPFRTRWMA